MDDMEHAEGWRKFICNKYVSTLLTLFFGFVLTRIGYSNIWPLFGSANQLLSALVLVTLCVFMKVTGRSNKMLFPPLAIMLCVTTTALVQDESAGNCLCLRLRHLHGETPADHRHPFNALRPDHRRKLPAGLLRLQA